MEISSLNGPPVLFQLDHLSQVGEVRRLAVSMAGRLGFNEQDQGRLALVLTEVAKNVIKHAGGGEIVLRPTMNSSSSVEALVVDKGPGMADVSRALQDGYSTAGTPGTGLGAIARLSTKFDLYSALGLGTVLLLQVWSEKTRRPEPTTIESFEAGTVCLPHPRESVFGDAWAVRRVGDRTLIIIADGLGHGPEAAVASEQAVRLFQASRADAPAAILAEVHGALRSTRGAAVAVASLDRGNQEIRYAGVGNIAASVITADQSRSMVSHNGTIGHEVRKIQEFGYPFPPEALVIMHSDGLQTHWRLDRYPGLTARDPAIIAAVLYRDFSRGRDDVTVLAVRERARTGERL